MQVARVIGMAHGTVKHSSMTGCKLLVVQPQMADGNTPDGDPLIAVDGAGAGVGERVLLTSDGRGARELLKVDATPVRWAIIAIQDEPQQ